MPWLSFQWILFQLWRPGPPRREKAGRVQVELLGALSINSSISFLPLQWTAALASIRALVILERALLPVLIGRT